MESDRPNRPAPTPVILDGKTTAVGVLDLTNRQREWFAAELYSKLMQKLTASLDQARRYRVLIVYTVSTKARGTPEDGVADSLKRQETEPVIYPDAYDKFAGGELQELLSRRGIKNLVLVGSGANIAVLHTATTAARVYGYNVIIPVDGVIARGRYEEEYAFHHLSVLPGGTSKLIRFTTLSGISFQ